MYTKFDKLYQILSENPDKIFLKNGEFIKWNSRKLRPVVFSAYENCVAYFKAYDETINDNHGDLDKIFDEVKEAVFQYKLSDEKIKDLYLADRRVHTINFNRDTIYKFEHERVDGRFWRTENGIISFWKPHFEVKKNIEGIDKMIRELGYDPKKVMWDPGYTGKRGHALNNPDPVVLLTRTEYFNQSNSYGGSTPPEGRHEVPGMKKSMNQLNLSPNRSAFTNFLMNLGRGA